MKILLINHYAGSLKYGMEYRPFYMAREWKRAGHQVIIVASSESHVRTISPMVHCGLTRIIDEGIEYHWLKTPKYQGNGFTRGINIFIFIAQLFRYAGKWVREYKPDLVITSSTYPYDNIPGKWIALRAGAKLVYEIHDLFLLSLTELGNIPARHPLIMFSKQAEKFALRKADHVISLLPNALSYLHARGLSPEKYNNIPNGIVCTEWGSSSANLPETHNQMIKQIRSRGNFIVGYAGAHGRANALDTLLDAAKLVQDQPVTFLLVGQGPEKECLEKRCRDERIGNVVFLAPINKDAIPSLFSLLDALYIGFLDKPLYQFGISPNKLIDYMMSGKPIICAMTAGNDPVSEAGCGLTISPENPQNVAGAIHSLLSISPSDRDSMGSRGKEYVKNHHDYRILAREFLDAVS